MRCFVIMKHSIPISVHRCNKNNLYNNKHKHDRIHLLRHNVCCVRTYDRVCVRECMRVLRSNAPSKLRACSVSIRSFASKGTKRHSSYFTHIGEA